MRTEPIYHYPGEADQDTYEWENRIADPERCIERFMESVVPMADATVADIGAGGGFHTALYALQAAHVYAVEPAPLMLRQLYARLATSGHVNVSVLAAGAENIPLQDACVNIIHSRFAYFFGPATESVRSCEPGIIEALRLLRPGGAFFIIDNSLTSGRFAALLAHYGYTRGQAEAMERRNEAFYAAQGFQHENIASVWRAPDRQTLCRVLAMEFPGIAVDTLLPASDGTEISYHYRIYFQRR